MFLVSNVTQITIDATVLSIPQACAISLQVIFIAWTIASAEYAVTRSIISSHIVLV